MNTHAAIRPESAQMSPYDRGPWNATATGGAWSLLNPSPLDLRFSDVAISLSRICRFNGQMREDIDFYSVAEHSALQVEWAVEREVVTAAEDAVALLVHDASESFFGDMTTEIKKVVPEYKVLEKKAQGAVNEAFGLVGARVMMSPHAMKRIDTRIFMTEAIALMHEPQDNNLLRHIQRTHGDLDPLDVRLKCLLPVPARRMFVSTFLDIVDRLPARDPVWKSEISHHIEDARQMLARMDSSKIREFENAEHQP